MPSVLYDRIVEVDERIVLEQSDCGLKDTSETVTATTGDKVNKCDNLHSLIIRMKLRFS